MTAPSASPREYVRNPVLLELPPHSCVPHGGGRRRLLQRRSRKWASSAAVSKMTLFTTSSRGTELPAHMFRI